MPASRMDAGNPPDPAPCRGAAKRGASVGVSPNPAHPPGSIAARLPVCLRHLLHTLAKVPGLPPPPGRQMPTGHGMDALYLAQHRHRRRHRHQCLPAAALHAADGALGSYLLSSASSSRMRAKACSVAPRNCWASASTDVHMPSHRPLCTQHGVDALAVAATVRCPSSGMASATPAAQQGGKKRRQMLAA